MGHYPATFSLSLFFQRIQLTGNIQYKFCRWLNSKRGPLESEATTLPTKPRPLPDGLKVAKKILLTDFLHPSTLTSGQSYKASMLVNYGSRVVSMNNLLVITTLDA